jgi:two-component system, NtrC family, sensor kinase
MQQARIKSRVWLSIGIFVLGYLLSTVVSLLERSRAEEGLTSIAEVALPAVTAARDAVVSFDEVENAYRDAFVMGDRTGLTRAAASGVAAVKALRMLASGPRIPSHRRRQAAALVRDLESFLGEAGEAYRLAAGNPLTMDAGLSGQIRGLGVATPRLKAQLHLLASGLSADLEHSTQELRQRSARMRVFVGGMFVATVLISMFLVNLTIQRSVLVPLARSQQELSREREMLQILMDNSPDTIYFKDAESRFLRVNRAQAALMGVATPEEAIGHTDADFFDADAAHHFREDERRLLESGRPMVGKLEQLKRDGLSCWLMSTKVPVRGVLDGSDLIVGISRDMTEWKGALEALEKSEESFRLLFDAIPHAVWVFDVETLRFLNVNQSACRQYGYRAEEFSSLTVLDLHPPPEAERMRGIVERIARCEDQLPPEGNWQHRTHSGESLEVVVHSRLLRLGDDAAILTVAEDISARRRLELELQQAQRLEAVGQLAAGIGHEINTPVQFVGDNLHFLKDAFGACQKLIGGQTAELAQAIASGQASPALRDQWEQALETADMEYLSEEVPRALGQSMDGVDRVATIVRAMKAFAHPGREDKAPADLNKAISDTLTVSRNEIKYVADVETDFGDLPPVVCHLGDLNQVFLNLLVNAAQAIAPVVEGTGLKGKIVVRTRAEDNLVTVSISDTGSGIPESIRERVFNPFFTTKAVGKGTGQGLALARSIVVDKHGGKIRFEPNSPRGTIFHVLLPADGHTEAHERTLVETHA